MNPEKHKYDAIYQAMADGSEKYGRYGHGSHGSDYKEIIMMYEHVLDVGCGQNDLMKACRKLSGDEHFVVDLENYSHYVDNSGVPYNRFTGVDFSCQYADVIADVTDFLPYPDKCFDLVTSFDLMEHLRPEQIDPALQEMQRVGKRFMFTIHFGDCGFRVDGEPLHMTQESAEFWVDKITPYSHRCHRNGNFFWGDFK